MAKRRRAEREKRKVDWYEWQQSGQKPKSLQNQPKSPKSGGPFGLPWWLWVAIIFGPGIGAVATRREAVAPSVRTAVVLDAGAQAQDAGVHD